jgi:hypothetical protein
VDIGPLIDCSRLRRSPWPLHASRERPRSGAVLFLADSLQYSITQDCLHFAIAAMRLWGDDREKRIEVMPASCSIRGTGSNGYCWRNPIGGRSAWVWARWVVQEGGIPGLGRPRANSPTLSPATGRPQSAPRICRHSRVQLFCTVRFPPDAYRESYVAV